MMADRHGRPTWWPTDKADRHGGRQTWPTDMADRHGRPTWPTDMADRHGGRPTRPTDMVATDMVADRHGQPTWPTDMMADRHRIPALRKAVLDCVGPVEFATLCGDAASFLQLLQYDQSRLPQELGKSLVRRAKFALTRGGNVENAPLF
ncbi:hypothetical protein BV898_13005 [Hypsibius exemplaris]|uniref:Uncharacterized protein n=1 Tax=Hypsibius exemplaris TaxID=2072580 RepID=A0A1W0WC37_HYPEX|nr:hypothetical protein BV898_13005 [Hypsibius exemplaris]